MPKEKWRSGYTTTTTSDPHSSLGNKTPAEARRAFEQFKGSAHGALDQTDDEKFEIQTRKLSLWMREPRGAGHSADSLKFLEVEYLGGTFN